MKSIEIIVPRKLITSFYPHPELYGDFIVELQNGMITDVYYNEDGDFMTITSEDELIDYLNNQDITPTKFLYRNGVFACREIDIDDEHRLNTWRNQTPIKESKFFPLEVKDNLESLGVPLKIIATLYWIEVGFVEIKQVESGIVVLFEVYEMNLFNKLTKHNLLSDLDIDIFIDMIKEYITAKLPIE